MELHKLLLRQLNRLDLAQNTLPSTFQQWQGFLERVDKAYNERDQERYLLERSMIISSRELMDLNNRLEIAQHIGKLGYWEVDLLNNKVFWSKELFLLHGLTPGSVPPNYEQFLKMVHDEDRFHMKTLLEGGLTPGRSYENELRIQSVDGKYRWFQVTFQRILKDDLDFIKGISVDITNRKKAEKEIATLHHQVVLSARMAGMADIATSTLHNVGNVLNSANVSVELLKEYMLRTDFNKIMKVMSLLEEHSSDLGAYIYKDPQGKLVPEYLMGLIKNVKREYEVISQEVQNLSSNITHISNIITTQNDMSRAAGMTEHVFLPDLMDSALQMSDSSFEQNHISIVKNYQKLPFVNIDRVKLLQILTNLIRNAKEALIENLKKDEKVITLSIHDHKEAKEVIIQVKDNGIGILPENLKRIFSFGFTTKEKGHGLGLHMSLLNTKDIGGTLTVESKGFGKGTTFTLTLPRIEVHGLV
ncbi:MAG: PAS domain-containing protein [Alphaproteobacteria bacterium]|nr:PAS domain-containing protein [Alphaproteobacteria bacterium]